MITEELYLRRAIFAEICQRARAGGEWGGFKPVAFESTRTDTQWFFLDTSYAYLFVFAGTNPRSIKDIMTDLMFRKKVIPYNNESSKIRVHRGFLRGYKSIRAQVHDAVRQHVVEPKPVLFLGHSMGGAYATHGAIDVQWNMREGALQDYRRQVYVFTFGSPRVGNGAFARSYRSRIHKTWRFWGWWDIVTKIPMLGYRHVTPGIGLACRHDIRKYIAQLDRTK